jgi:hypothetical protein
MNGKIYFQANKPFVSDELARTGYVAITPKPVDITEGVQVLYDHVIHSMDWGSGFLTVEDAKPIVTLAKLCGFEGWEEAQRYVEAEVQAQETGKFMNTIEPRGHLHQFFAGSSGICSLPGCSVKEGSPKHLASTKIWEEYQQKCRGDIPHEHVFSSVGKCMWPNCKQREETRT